jgi:hypothetical protein
MIATHTFDIVVSPKLQELLASAIVIGKGGYQSLFRLLKARMVERNTLELSPQEFRRLVRYSIEHGSGGFQAHCRELVSLWVYQHLDTIAKEE